MAMVFVVAFRVSMAHAFVVVSGVDVPCSALDPAQ